MGIVPNFWELGGEDAAVLNSVANSLANIPGFASVPNTVLIMILILIVMVISSSSSSMVTITLHREPRLLRNTRHLG